MAPSQVNKTAVRKRTIIAETKTLARTLDSLTTQEQITKASDLLTTLRFPGKENLALGRIDIYIQKQDHREWIEAEIKTHRVSGHLSSFLSDVDLLALE